MRNYLVAVLAAAAVFAVGVFWAFSGPKYSAVVLNGSSANITDVRFYATDYEGDLFGSGQASLLGPGEELRARVRGYHVHVRVDFTMEETAHVEYMGPIAYDSADKLTITVTPEGTLMSELSSAR